LAYRQTAGLPCLREAAPAAVAQVVPTDLTEEIGLATAAKSTGWLRLLASEAGGFRFEWPALRLIGQSQWEVGDYDGARGTWERVVGNDPDDVAANLALANLYERQYRCSNKPEHFQASEQAVARVLARDNWITAAQRAVVLA
jgi:tetratricopeptide (TPR) repeat protein